MEGLIQALNLGAQLVLMPIVAFLIGTLMVFMMRWVRARIERRVGPPFFQPFYDIVKLFGKQTQISHGVMQDAIVAFVIGGMITAVLFIPMPGMQGASAHADVVALIYLMMVPSLGMALGVGQTANPNGSIGISRALTALAAYDVPLMLCIAGAALAYGTTSLPQIWEAQAGGIAHWGIATMPVLAVAALIAIHAMLGKEPFEIYVAPAEIASGPMVEMSGKYLGSLMVMQSFQLYLAGALYTVLFLGGGNWPEFLAKMFAVVFVCVALTNVFPRYKTEDVVKWLWTWPTGLALLGIAWVMWG